METVDDIIVSDIHLGSNVSRSKKLIETLKKFSFKRLILNGDIFDDLNFQRLNTNDWDFLSYIRTLSDPNRNIEIVWIRGNHDHLLIDITAHFLGIKIYKEYEWISGKQKNLAIHGDQFDEFLVKNRITVWIASKIYYFMQKIDMKKQRLSRLLKRLSKSWLRVSKEVAEGASNYGKRKGANNVFCGHTHQVLTQKFENGINYYNSGCWTDVPSTFITIKESQIKTHQVY
jgi:UDP-2,3-diacylglucosamine pyrophosphatase LpxH